MKLFILDKQGVWGDTNSHPLPATVEVIPHAEISTVDVNGKTFSAVGGKFVINDLSDGIASVSVDGVPCEPLFCRNTGGTPRINAVGKDLRSILPYLARISQLEATVARHETQLTQKDFFG